MSLDQWLEITAGGWKNKKRKKEIVTGKSLSMLVWNRGVAMDEIIYTILKRSGGNYIACPIHIIYFKIAKITF